ncbi:hypothetical protein [Microbacterium sp.]|uniref:hypothetical protein n=1 Tax=Microbacterium sp. TaxID=51671 RepID=UPI0039E58B9B
MDDAFDPLPILKVLAAHRVRFVVIGGYAAFLQHAPFLTNDVDITPDQSAANLERLSAALTELDARIRTQSDPEGLPFNHNAASLAGVRVWNLTTPHGDLDISFVPNGTTGYDDLAADATDATIHGVTIQVASLADIIRSKQAANRPKDQRVLPTLREILAYRHAKNRA